MKQAYDKAKANLCKAVHLLVAVLGEGRGGVVLVYVRRGGFGLVLRLNIQKNTPKPQRLASRCAGGFSAGSKVFIK